MLLEVIKVQPQIYRLHFEKHYDLLATFMRFQEFYESPHFHGKPFTIAEFREWYSQQNGRNGKFTYFSDWDGFNLPSRAFHKLSRSKIPDHNEHDDLMLGLYAIMKRDAKGRRFYVLGTWGKKQEASATYRHEMAHAYWGIDPKYKQAMNALIDKMESETRRKLWAALRAAGYANHVNRDELQAYAATGTIDEMKDVLTPAVRKPFIKVFNKRWQYI